MPKTSKKKQQTSQPRFKEKIFESDSTYLLKLVVVFIIGTFWLKFDQPIVWLGIPLSGIPIGLALGLLLTRYFEPHQIDRKIWYAMLVVVGVITYFLPAGIMI